MKNIIVAPFGPHTDSLYIGIRELPTERIFLITPKDKVNAAEQVKSDLGKFKIPIDIMQIEGNLWDETFRAISEIKNGFERKDKSKNKSIIVNIGMADRNMMCAATSAAFVNGLKAIDIQKNGVMFLPVLKFSYYKLLTDRKMKILETLLNEHDCCSSLDELSKRTKMSLPLIAYHINGNQKSEGLKNMNLVETVNKKGKISVALTDSGKLLTQGYLV